MRAFVVGAGAWRGGRAVRPSIPIFSSGAGNSGSHSRGGMAVARAPLGAVAVAALVVAIFMPAAAAAQAPAPAPTSDGTPSLSSLSLSPPPFFSSCNDIAIWTLRICASVRLDRGPRSCCVLCSYRSKDPLCFVDVVLFGTKKRKNRHKLTCICLEFRSPCLEVNYSHNNANLLHMRFLQRQSGGQDAFPRKILN